MINIRTKRVYDKVHPEDGLRVLVDRVWPRGMKKEDIQASIWLKEVAPSTTLRKWFGHDRLKWMEFKKRYFRELDENSQAATQLLQKAGHGTVTLLFSARDTECNQAAALREYLLLKLGQR